MPKLDPDPNPKSFEPVLSVAGVAAAVGAVLTLLITFGVNLTPTQVEAILGVVLIAGPLVLGVLTRGKVYA
ncbi:MAG: hypothetical protein ACRDJ9_35130, partial [Dehalococcoidia bacterium]